MSAIQVFNPVHYDNTHFRPEQLFLKKDVSTFYKPRSNSSLKKQAGSINNIDVPRRVVKGNMNKYVTTATVDNFYSYRTSSDVDLGDSGSEQYPKTATARRYVEKTSFVKPRSDKRPRKQENVLYGMTGKTRRNDGHEYGVSYKDKLQSELSEWSAEESDV